MSDYIGARRGHTETQVHDLHKYTVRTEGCDVVLVMRLEDESWSAPLDPAAARTIAFMLLRATYDAGMHVGPSAHHRRTVERLDRLRFDVQQLRDRLRRGEDIWPEQVAEMLGDMLEEP
jgi:hypothetical protein